MPGLPSALGVKNREVDIFEKQKIQIQKIEELILYLIELKKENELVKKEIETLAKK